MRISPVTRKVLPGSARQCNTFVLLCSTRALSALSARKAALGECSVTLKGDGGNVGQVLLDGGTGIAEQWEWRHISRLVAFTQPFILSLNRENNDFSSATAFGDSPTTKPLDLTLS